MASRRRPKTGPSAHDRRSGSPESGQGEALPRADESAEILPPVFLDEEITETEEDERPTGPLMGDGTKAPPFSEGAGYRPFTPNRFPENSESIRSPLAPPPALHNSRTSTESSYGGQMVEDDRIITKEGVRYLPLSLAAPLAKAPRTTLLDWVKAKTEFQGRPLQTYHSPTMRRFYLSEESVERVANRFVKWPSQEPAGPVTLGETKDHSGYIGIAKAARAIGIDHHTMWLWTARGNAPGDTPPDVIKCTASDQFYIRERDALKLKKHVPRSGLPRGRRPQPCPS